MTFSKVLLVAMLATTATVGFAATVTPTTVTPVVKKVVYITSAAGAEKLAKANSINARKPLYTSLIGERIATADPLMAAVSDLCFGPLSQLDDAVCDSSEGSTILKEILAYLKASGATEKQLSDLADKYATQIAFISNEVAPAAGPEAGADDLTNVDFTEDGSDNETLENPSQLSPNKV